jgi:16S rRNA (guanine527-N7)-methyltransferase
MPIPVDLLSAGARQLGNELTPEQISQFERFADLLIHWNRKFNLTRITDPEEIVMKHFLDSLTCLNAAEFPLGAMIIDVGTGPGMPGIPLKIARPDLLLVLLDSVRKKLTFLDEVVRELNLSNVETLHSRAEDAGHHIKHRERYDIVLARALGRFAPLSELCLPLAKVKGTVLAMKGPNVSEELQAAEHAIGTLGGRIEKVVETAIPGTDMARTIVVIRKLRQTLKKYPRSPADIERSPL